MCPIFKQIDNKFHSRLTLTTQHLFIITAFLAVVAKFSSLDMNPCCGYIPPVHYSWG